MPRAHSTNPTPAPKPKPYPHPAALAPDELLKQCTWSRDRSGGPGGQHRNKVETAVTITHSSTGLSAFSTTYRSQIQNKKSALRRLRLRLALTLRQSVSIPGYLPSPLLAERLRQQKKFLKVNEKHEDFPAILAEVLDLVFALEGEVGDAGDYLRNLSPSQLIKFLKTNRHALPLVNELRKQHGKHILK